MSLVFLRYPAVVLLFLSTVILILLAQINDKHAFTFGILSGIALIITIISGLFYAVPSEEILLLLLILLYSCSLKLQKGGKA